MENKTLHLTLKKKWFDMIASGEKKEEYREIKPYWIKRLTNLNLWQFADFEISQARSNILQGEIGCLKQFDTVTFKNGYQKDAPTIIVELLWITVGEPMKSWSDDWKGDVFIIRLGEIL